MTTTPTGQTNPTVPAGSVADPLPVTTEEWEDLGRQAFHNGEHAAPALNATVMAALEGEPVGGDGVRIMTAFGRGWMAANLAAPVPGVDEDIQAATVGKPRGEHEDGS